MNEGITNLFEKPFKVIQSILIQKGLVIMKIATSKITSYSNFSFLPTDEKLGQGILLC
jgi:hypothetical protein